MEAGVCGHPGGSAAGPAVVESPPLSDTVTAPGTDLSADLFEMQYHL